MANRKRQDHAYGKGEYSSTLKIKHQLKHDNKASKKQGIIISWDMCDYLCIHKIKNQEKGVAILSK